MRLNIERQQELEPKRLEHYKKKLEDFGYEVTIVSATTLTFEFKGSLINVFPYSGWHTGKTIKDGRGLSNLIKQIKQ
jgi:transcription-repair coupling factor (superfamily II helicase)